LTQSLAGVLQARHLPNMDAKSVAPTFESFFSTALLLAYVTAVKLAI